MIVGVHVCEGCGKMYETLGPYWNCLESHGIIVSDEDEEPLGEVHSV